MNNESILQTKREKFRIQIRKDYLQEQLKKKRIIEPLVVDTQELNEKLQKIISEIQAIEEKVEEYSVAMTKYYDTLVDQDLINEILEQFKYNYNYNCRIHLYWILSNLTLGNGIGGKLLFDTNFNLLELIYNDLKIQDYATYGLEIIQNLLADRDIDVFETLMIDDQIIKVLNSYLETIPMKQYEQLLVHISSRIVQFKAALGDYFVQTICNKMPQYIAFQCAYILIKNMEEINENLLFHSLQYLMLEDQQIQFILLKILQQVEQYDLLIKFFQSQQLYQQLRKILLSTNNPDVINIILIIYQHISEIEQLKHIVTEPQIINYIISLSCETQFCQQALKLLEIFLKNIEYQQKFSILLSENYFIKQITNLSIDNPAESIQILTFCKILLDYGDEVNDSRFEFIFKQYKNFVENLNQSQNDFLASLSRTLLYSYE